MSLIANPWRNPTVRSITYQVLVVAGIVWLVVTAFSNAVANLRQRGVSTGLSFLRNEAGISIPETPPVPSDPLILVIIAALVASYLVAKYAALRLLSGEARRHANWAITAAVVLGVIAVSTSGEWVRYHPSESYLMILVTGIANTLRIGAVAAVAAVVLGFVLGICALSTNWLLRNLVHVVTETARNVPILLHVLFWYTLILNVLPPVRASLSVGGLVFFSNRGIFFPSVEGFDPTALTYTGAGLALALFVTTRRALGTLSAAFVGAVTLLLVLGSAGVWNVPSLRGFNFAGGSSLTPEYSALLTGLVVYYGSFIADIVRSAIRAIPPGQWEGASSLGLTRLKSIRLVIIPQAMRIIVPPLSNQMLGLAKDTSIGVAVAYPEFVAISRTVINQTGQALEVMFLVMSFFLLLNLAISSALNLYNAKIGLRGR
jgi:general L-amino acid transport system permease protein